MAKKKPPHTNCLSQVKNCSLTCLAGAWDYCTAGKGRRNTGIALVIALALFFFFSRPAIINRQSKQVRINNLVTKSLKCDVIKMSPFARLEDVENITMAGVLLDLNSSTIMHIEKNADVEVNNAVADCLKPNADVRLGSQSRSQKPYHTLKSQKGVADFNFEAESNTIEFLQRQECLRINIARGKIEDGRIAFANEDLIELTSSSEIICNSKTISQNQDWRIELVKKGDLFLLGYEPKSEVHEINFYFKANSLKTPKHILAISEAFTTEIKNLMLTDAEGIISIGKDRHKLEAYDVLEIRDTEDVESKFNLSILQLGQDGIIIRANGSAADICLNGTQLITSRLENFIKNPIYYPIVAALLIIISNFIARIFKK